MKLLTSACFSNAGQRRDSVERIYVHKNVFSEFTNKFTKNAFENLQLGDPMLETTNIGPIAVMENIEKYNDVVADA